MVCDSNEVKLRIRDRYNVQITPAFKCIGIWPRSAAHWPVAQIPWPHPGKQKNPQPQKPNQQINFQVQNKIHVFFMQYYKENSNFLTASIDWLIDWLIG